MDERRGTVCVVGAAGFVGRFLVPTLQSSGWVVRTVDKKDHEIPGATAFVGDVRELDSLIEPFCGASLIINLAAEHRDDVQPVELYDQVNVEGARNICAAAARLGIPRQIFTSSVAVYGSGNIELDEDHAHAYFNDYGRTKHLAELEYETWRTGGVGRQLAIVRPTVIFGPGNRGNVYNLLRQIKYGPFVMFGDGKNRKSMAAVQNVAGFLAFLSRTEFDRLCVNYADKPDFDMNGLVAFVDQTLGRKGRRIRAPAWAGRAAGRLADAASKMSGRSLPVSYVRVIKFLMKSEISTARLARTGFSPVINLRDALSDMVREEI